MDSVFIKRVLSGDCDAFEHFVSKYKDFGFALSYSVLKDSFSAEEAVQKSFIKAFEKLHTFRENATFKTWFGRIIINESLREINKYKESNVIKNISEEEISDVDFTLNNLIHKERKFLISEVFKNLSHEESLILELYYLKEFTIKEICKVTDWSQSKVKMLNLRGRKNFYHQMRIILKHEMKDVL